MSKRRLIKIVSWTAGVAIAVGMLETVTVHTRTRSTCLLCRAERTDHRFLGFEWQTSGRNEFTEWYDSHRPAHGHLWERSGCTRGQSIFGQTLSWSCGRNHPINQLPPRTEREFAERADESTFEEFIRGIRSPHLETQVQAVNVAWETVLENK